LILPHVGKFGGGHVPKLVHWGVNRHTVDKSGGLSVIIPLIYHMIYM